MPNCTFFFSVCHCNSTKNCNGTVAFIVSIGLDRKLCNSNKEAFTVDANADKFQNLPCQLNSTDDIIVNTAAGYTPCNCSLINHT